MEPSINNSILLSSMEQCIENVDAQKDDLISELPEVLLHQILSFLDMRYVVQTSILGKRWRYLWTSLPFLNFNEEEYNRSMKSVGGGEQKPDYKNFINFLNRILRLQSGSNLSIQSFHLCCDKSYVKEYEFARWSHHDLDRSLAISEFRALDLSKCFYTQLDHYVGLPCLKILYLDSVFLEGGKHTDNFFTSCPLLETLIILDCVVMQTDKLNISAPRLKHLELGKLTTDMFQFSMFEDVCACSLKVIVCAPNLTLFKCKDLVSVEYSLLNASSVVEADIDVECPTGFFFSGTNEKDTQIVMDCLAALCSVESLRLSAWWLEAVYEVYKPRMGSLVTPFCNLRSLKLKTSLSTPEYRAIKYLFESCPNVETLVLEITKPPDQPVLIRNGIYVGSSEERQRKEPKMCLEAYLSSECIFSLHHLKFVEIRNATGNLNLLEYLKLSGSLNDLKELQLLRFLLKNATFLEKVTVFFSEVGLLDEKMRRRFSEELMTFSASISAGVDISFI